MPFSGICTLEMTLAPLQPGNMCCYAINTIQEQLAAVSEFNYATRDGLPSSFDPVIKVFTVCLYKSFISHEVPAQLKQVVLFLLDAGLGPFEVMNHH